MLISSTKHLHRNTQDTVWSCVWHHGLATPTHKVNHPEMRGRPGWGDKTDVSHCSSLNSSLRPTEHPVKCYVHSRPWAKWFTMTFTVPDTSTQSQFDTDNIKVIEGALRSGVCWGCEQKAHSDQHVLFFFVVVLVCAVQQCGSAVSDSPLPHPTPWAITGHWAELPVLYSSSPLALYFTHRSVCMSLLLPQLVPPSPSPAVSMRPFSMSESLFLSGR